MYKAVFIDIDGTFIRSDHSVSQATIAIVQKLKEKGIMVVLISARPLHGILRIAGEAGLNGFPVAGLNGACIAVDEKIIFESVIDIAATVMLYERLQQYNATLIYYRQIQWFAEMNDLYTKNEQKITDVPVTILPFKSMLRHWKNENEGPHKILVVAGETVINEIQNNLKPRFNGQLNIYTSKPTYLEVMNKDASKANAVRFLINQYNIKQEETIAIGDNFNDKEMIAFAGTGIAMGNAPAEVKAAADYITDTNNNDGVAKALSVYFDL